jgi:hypothetical protein
MKIAIAFHDSAQGAIENVTESMRVIAAQIPGLSKEQRALVTQTLVNEVLGSTESAFARCLSTPVVAVNKVHEMTREVLDLYETSRSDEVKNLFEKMELALKISASERGDEHGCPGCGRTHG